MKCGDCGATIPPRRGYCVTAKCHNKALGGPTPEKYAPLKTWQRMDQKRCPHCSGVQGKWEGRGECWRAACDRGPEGKRCDCHQYLGVKIRGMPSSFYARVAA